MKAIIVDDSRAIRIILRNALIQEGFEVVEAGDGKQGLEAIRNAGQVDLALVDWNMPVMTGYEMLREVRADKALDGMAVMMVTTETETDQVKRALDAGANEYVMKPVSPEVLREKLLLLGFAKE